MEKCMYVWGQKAMECGIYHANNIFFLKKHKSTNIHLLIETHLLSSVMVTAVSS